MAMVKSHCHEYLSICSSHLCAGFQGDLAGFTVFHVLACVPPDDHDTVRMALDESQWPHAKELSHMALRKNDLGLLPSACAAGRGNIPLCARLTELEYVRVKPSEDGQ